MRKIFMVVMLLLTCAHGCRDSTSSMLCMSELDWICGEWKGTGGGGVWFEVWNKEQNGDLNGFAYALKGPDTLFKESMSIRQEGQVIVFKADVAHNEAPVPFDLIEVTQKGWVFQNLDHDFPNRIIYARTKGDMLLARIEGIREGKPDTVRFFMSRVIKFSAETNTPGI